MRMLEQIPIAVLSIGDELGKGRFKKVHKGRHKRREVVVLRYSKEADTNEMNILAMLALRSSPGNSEFVPEIFGVAWERDFTSIVQEWAPLGSLKGALKAPDFGQRITVEHKLCASVQISRAMDFLVSAHVVHADLSCRNVLMFQFEDPPNEINVKIADFGLSVILADGTDSERRKQPQATRWCAPETITHTKLSHRSDVWAFGATLWELMHNGTAPWVRRDKRADVAARLRDLAEHGGLAEGGTDVSDDFPAAPGTEHGLHEVLLACLQVDEYARPTFTQLAERLGRLTEEAQVPSNDLLADARIDGRMDGRTDVRVESRMDGSDGKAGSLKTPTPTTAVPSRDRSPTRVDQDGVTTIAKPWTFQDEACEEFADRFPALKTFLRSDRSVEAVGDEAVRTMWQELDEAQAREAYLMDLIRRMQTTATESRETAELLDPESPLYRSVNASFVSAPPQRRSDSPFGLGLNSSVAALGMQIRSESVPKSPHSVPRRSVRSQLVPPPLGLTGSSRGLMSGVPSYDHIVPLTPAGGSLAEYAAPLPPHDNMWTLWSFIGSALRRQDFHQEADAWAAFELVKAQPCMLRDPSGAEVAAHSWVASYFQLIPGANGNTITDVQRRLASPQRPASRSGCSLTVSAWT